MSDNPLTDILSGVSSYLNELIDDRLDQRFTTTVLPPAIREEISRIIDARVADVTNSPGHGVPNARINEAVERAVKEAMIALLSGPQFRVMLDPIIKSVVADEIDEVDLDGKAEDAVDNWMDDTSNVSKLSRNMDIEEAVDDVLRGGNFEVTFRR